MHIDEPSVSGHRSFQADIATEKLKRYTSSETDQILTELIQAGGSTLHSEINKRITSI
jgi:hypothetical protein